MGERATGGRYPGSDAGEREKLMREHGLSDDSAFVLRVLDEAFGENRRMGRRSIAMAAKESGLFIGEQRARMITEDLEKKGLVTIGRGKAGTVITADGRELAGKLG
jgi:repressor of nif and glnA expression